MKKSIKKGWKSKMSEEKKCFVIAPIGEADTETRKRSDQVLKHIIKPAVESCGYDAVRADHLDKPGIITSQVIQCVVEYPLVIADLSEMNPNVFYELAIRHAIRKPLVQIIRKGDRIPFDIAGTRTIEVDHHDLDSVELAKTNISDQIKSVENQTIIDTPISVSLDLQILRQSDNPEERSLADIMAVLSDIKNNLQVVEAQNIKAIESSSNTQINELLMRLDRELSIGVLKRKKRFDPYLSFKMAELSIGKTGDPIGILVLFSSYHEDLPWLYEIGATTYRYVKDKKWGLAQETIESLKQTIRFFFDEGALINNTNLDKRELFLLVDELPNFLEKIVYLIKRRNSSEEP